MLEQAKALRRFVPYFIGSRQVQEGLPVPLEKTLVVNSGGFPGRLKEVSYKLLTGKVSHKLWRAVPLSFVRRVQMLNPLLIHAHFGVDGAIALPLSRALSVPLLVTFHGYDATEKDEVRAKRSNYGEKIYLQRREELKREAPVFIAVSCFIAGKLVEQGFPQEKILVHYVGVDTKVFRSDSTLAREPVVLFVGRLVENKGCEFLLRAMNKVQSLMPEVELVIIGDGPLRSSLERLARKTLRRYRFLGALPPEEVRSWMNRAKVFSVPSITIASGASEGFGLVSAEAQAMGLPVASFATGGIPEVVAHGETGLLAAERDWEGLARHISLLLRNNALWSKFSTSGQRRISTLFDLQRQTGILEEVYQRVLEEKARSALDLETISGERKGSESVA